MQATGIVLPDLIRHPGKSEKDSWTPDPACLPAGRSGYTAKRWGPEARTLWGAVQPEQLTNPQKQAILWLLYY